MRPSPRIHTRRRRGGYNGGGLFARSRMRAFLPALLLTAACTGEVPGLPYDVEQPLYEGDGPPAVGSDGSDGTDDPSDETTTGGLAGDLPPGSPVYGSFDILSDFGSIAAWEFEGVTVECEGCVWAFEGEFTGSSVLYLGWEFRESASGDWISYLSYYGSTSYWGPASGDGAGRAEWQRTYESYYGYYGYSYYGVVFY